MITNSRKNLSYATPPVRGAAKGTHTKRPPELRPWETWLRASFPGYVSSGFAPRHTALWDWFSDLARGERPRTKVDIWPRGGAKSTTAELGCVYVGMKQTRHFVLYVCKTQTQADAHVQAISALLEALGVERSVNKYNQSKGWTQQILRTADNFNVVSLGLDAAARGIKLDQYRPDVIVLDDVDDRHDTADLVKKKIVTLTESILPTGSPDAAILFVQNRIHENSIIAQIADRKADFLLDRLPVTEEPAVYNLEYEQVAREDGEIVYRITGGIPSWEGQNLDTCEAQMNDWGRRAFLREAQHQVKQTGEGLWNAVRDITPYRVALAPTLIRVVVAVDPSATSTGDAAGIVVVGRGSDNHLYVLADVTVQGSPRTWAMAAVAAFHTFRADALVAEKNNGGEMVELTIQTVEGAPPVKLVHASRGKLTRAEPIQKVYEDGKAHHVGVFADLEEEMTSWKPGQPSPNRMDALVWGASEVLFSAVQTAAPAVDQPRVQATPIPAPQRQQPMTTRQLPVEPWRRR